MRRYTVSRWIWLIGVLGLTVFAWTQEFPDVRPMMQDVFPVSRVKPGMKGYGLTVFKGTKIERFEVEVVGVLENMIYGRPLVMIMMRGGPITERGAMVIGGMSGSPIFIEGKILGALAYGFLFPKEPVALVTPMEAMLTNLHPRAEAQLTAFHPPRLVQQPVRINGKRYAGVYIGHEKPTASNVAWARPLMTPLMVSGASPRTLKRLEALLKPYGITPLMASGGTAKQVPVRFEPGAAVGAPLATGDIDLTAIGTLTYRNGDYVLAFGHPFFGLGKVEMPMTAAEIVDVFSSYADSFKLGNRAQSLGTVYYDGAFAIAGRLGRRAQMLPMRVRISNLETGVQREFRCEVMRHRLFVSEIAAIAVQEFIDRVYYDIGDATATVRWRLSTRPYGEIRFENRVATREALAFEVLSDLSYVMNLLANAPEQATELESLEMEVVVQPSGRAALIESLQVDKFTYRPGERVEATVQVRLPDGSASRACTFSLRLPADALPGRYLLQVGAGGGSPARGVPPALLAFLLGEASGGGGGADTAQRLREFLERERNYQLIATLNLPFPTISAGGTSLLQLPPLMRSVLMSPRASKAQQTADRIKQVIDTPYVLQGAQSVSITVLPPESGRMPFGAAGAPPFAAAYTEFESYSEAEPEGDSHTVSVESTTTVEFQGVSESPPMPAEFASPDEPRAGQPAQRERVVSRAARIWRPQGFEALRRGTFEGTALHADGSIRLAVAPQAVRRVSLEFIWSALPDGDTGLLVGGGVGGRLLRIAQEPSEQTYPALPGVFVTALARADNGELYAGLSPEGVICRVGQQSHETVLQTGARYVNALRWHKGALYIATGAPARILAWENGQLHTLLTTDETHFCALALDEKGTLYAGTAERGIVYRISPTGVATPIADLQEPNIMALATDGAGNLYIATAPFGNLYRWTPEGNLTPLHPQGRLNWRCLIRHEQTLYALTDSEVYALSLSEALPKPALLFRQQGLQLIGGEVAGERLLLASADGQLITLVPQQEGVYLSPVLDAGAPARWGTLRWSATVPEGAQVLVQTRSGNTREPDATWSAWTTTYADAEGSPILSPPAQYLQVRVQLKASGDARPTLNQFSVSYLPANRPPTVQLIGLTPYAVLSGKQTLRWRGRDPDGDTLRFEVQLSRDGGQTWQPLKNGKPNQANAASRVPAAANAEQSAGITITDIQLDDSIPPALREQLRQRIAQGLQERGATIAPAAVGAPDEAESKAQAAEEPPTAGQNRQPWDTTQTPDGVYLLRVMATDQPASPADYATVYSPAVPVVVCNTPPIVVVSERNLRVGEDGVAELTGFALQTFAEPADKTSAPSKAASSPESKQGEAEGALSAKPSARRTPRHSAPITGVQYKVGNGEWRSAEPLDGLFDSAFEAFRIRTDALPAGEHTLTIKVFNAAGKSAETQQKVKVERKQPPATP